MRSGKSAKSEGNQSYEAVALDDIVSVEADTAKSNNANDTKPDADVEPEKQGSITKTTFWFSFFTIASVSMVILNKYSIMQLSEPYSILLFQNSMTILLNAILVYVGVFKVNEFTLEQFKIFALPSTLFVAMLTFSLKAYEAVSVATVVVSRAISTVLVAFGDFLFFKKKFTTEELFYIGIVLFGAVVFAIGDREGTAYGYLMTGINMALFIFIQLYEKFQITHSTQTPVGISCVQNIISVPILIICVMANGENLVTSIQGTDTPYVTTACLILTGFAGCALSIIYMTLNKIASATAISLGGNFNKLTSVLIGFVVFKNNMQISQMLGLIFSMGGTFMYSQAKRKAKKKTTNK